MSAPDPASTSTLEFPVALIEKTRAMLLKTVEGLSSEQWRVVPKGFHNNLLWNLGHVTVSQQLLCYEKSGQALRIPAYFLPLFRKGTNPGEWKGQIDVEEVKTWLLETLRLLREDIAQGRFGTFTPYQTGTGIWLNNLSETLAFTAWHESQHLGIVLSLRKLV